MYPRFECYYHLIVNGAAYRGLGRLQLECTRPRLPSDSDCQWHHDCSPFNLLTTIFVLYPLDRDIILHVRKKGYGW
jgi:hypothetical protein